VSFGTRKHLERVSLLIFVVVVVVVVVFVFVVVALVVKRWAMQNIVIKVRTL